MIFVLLALAASIYGQNNWTGDRDTSDVKNLKGTATVRSRVFQGGQYEHHTIVVMFNDTSAAGYAGDSCVFAYGYELGVPVVNTSGNRDTAWSPIVYVDSISTLGVTTASQQDSTLGTTKIRSWSDTSNVSGWAYTFSQIIPEGGAPLIRYVATGITGNSILEPLRLRFQRSARLGNSVETK
jgi:hypothetical protein